MKARKSYMLHIARQVLTGDLSVEEAMQKSHVKDKRTIVRWLRQAIRENQSASIPVLTLDKQRCGERHDAYSPEEKIRHLESQLEGFKQRNLELVRFQTVLSNKINELEVLIDYAERTYQIEIMQIRKRKSK